MNSNDRLDNYRLIALLGKGQSGGVWSAIRDNDGHGVTALKIFKGKNDAETRVRHEYEMATQFDHPNILRPTEMKKLDEYWTLIMPICEGLSVEGVAGFLSEKLMWMLIRDIASALSYIHNKGYVHADVKPSNILWTGKKFMLTDFSSCRKCCEPVEVEKTATDGSSFRYRAPETAALEFVPACDVWSLGATAFCLFMGCDVFNGHGGSVQKPNSPIPFMRKDRRELSELVSHCLAFGIEQRPTAAEICAIADTQLTRTAKQTASRPHKQVAENQDDIYADDFWPEKMID